MPKKSDFKGLKTFKYGMPLYGVAWPEGDVFYMCGGGGMGIKNRLVFAESRSGLISDQIGDFHFGEDCPMRLAISPNGQYAVMAMTKGGIARLDLDCTGPVPKAVEMTGDVLEKMSVVEGDVRCLAFSASGEQLALGVGDGGLQVYEWPSMKLTLDLSGETKLADSVRSVDFSHRLGERASGGGPTHSPCLLAAVLDDGSCELWDWQQGKLYCRIALGKDKLKNDKVFLVTTPGKTLLQHLPKGMEGSRFVQVKFSREGDNGFHTLTNCRSGAYISKWTVPQPGQAPPAQPAVESEGGPGASAKGSEAMKHPEALPLPVLGSRIKACEDAGTCFVSSDNGSLLAVGTSEGSAVVFRTHDLHFMKKLPKAHMVFTTGVTFSPNQRQLLSISADASCQITSLASVEPSRCSGIIRILLLLILLLAAAAVGAYYLLKATDPENEVLVVADDLIHATADKLGFSHLIKEEL